MATDEDELITTRNILTTIDHDYIFCLNKSER